MNSFKIYDLKVVSKIYDLKIVFKIYDLKYFALIKYHFNYHFRFQNSKLFCINWYVVFLTTLLEYVTIFKLCGIDIA